MVILDFPKKKRSLVNGNHSQQNIENYIQLSEKIISLQISERGHLHPELCLRQQGSYSLIPAVYEFGELDYSPIKELFEMNKSLDYYNPYILIGFNESLYYYDPNTYRRYRHLSSI